MLLRQLRAAIARCASVRLTWTSFSAAAKVPASTSGPTAGAVPNAGGVPTGVCWVFCPIEWLADWSEAAAVEPRTAAAELMRNSRREFDTAWTFGKLMGARRRRRRRTRAEQRASLRAGRVARQRGDLAHSCYLSI